MENILEIFHNVFQFSRFAGVAPFSLNNHYFKISPPWKFYSYLILFINLILQIMNQVFLFKEYDFREKVNVIARICDYIGYPLNSILSSILILSNLNALEDLQSMNYFYQRHQNLIKYKHIQTLKYLSRSVFIISLAAATFLFSLQCYCYNPSRSSLSYFGIIKCVSVIGRAGTTIGIACQFITYVFVLRLHYKILNSALHFVRKNICGMRLSWHKCSETVDFIHELMITEFIFKKIIEKVNSLFGIFNLFATFNAFTEITYVMVFRAIYYNPSHCLNIGYCWVSYSVSILMGSLISSILVRREVSKRCWWWRFENWTILKFTFPRTGALKKTGRW